MNKTVMLTTTDNPWNPGTHWAEWNAYDLSKGHNTNGLLARFLISSDSLSSADQLADIEDAIDRVIEMNPEGVYKKILI